MSSGRSPYPTRSRRRQQALQQQHQHQQQQQHHQHGNAEMSSDIELAHDSYSSTSISPRHSLGSMSTATNTSSQFRLGQSLVQARLSPRMTSPNNNNNATRRFFEGSTGSTNAHTPKVSVPVGTEREAQGNSTNATPSTGAGATASASATASTTSATTNTTGATGAATTAPASLSSTSQATPNTTKPIILDGINITHLRQLATQALAHAHSASSPSMATFYASLAYAKTLSPEDALLYAQALLQSQESPKRCVRLLEQAGLFQYTNAHTHMPTLTQIDHKSNNNDNDKNNYSIPLTLRIEAVLLATQALATLDDWQAVLALLEDAHLYATIRAAPHESPLLTVQPLEDEDDIAWKAMTDAFPPLSSTTIHPLSRLCCMRARAYAETGHPLRAAIYYQRALRIDPQCVQALDGLLKDQLVQPQQALELIWNLNISQEWLRALYLARVHVAAPTTTATLPDPLELSSTQPTNKSITEDPFWNDDSTLQLLTPIVPNKPHDDDAMMGSGPNGRSRGQVDSNQLEVQGALDRLLGEFKLQQSSHVLAMAAQRAYRQSQLPLALKYCQELARVDPLCTTAAYVHVATLVALGHKRTLFRLAHEWVDAAPKSARAWFAVGSYYFACEKYHVAQRHFCRATRLNPQVVEAWIAFGASFAACDESDQALASFRAAQRLAPGDPTSLLYIGMEYLRTNHLSLAEHFLLAAHQASQGSNRLCLNELGVWHLQEKNYETAALWFVRTLSGVDTLDAAKQVLDTGLTTLLDAIQDVYWEPTVFNLAQALRKLRIYDSAIHCLERCLTLKPNNPSAWTALGFCHHLDGNVDKAIDVYHQALAQKPEDPFASEMLQRALQDALHDTTELMEELDLGPTKLSTSGLKAATRRSMDSASYMTDDGLSLSVASGDVDMG